MTELTDSGRCPWPSGEHKFVNGTCERCGHPEPVKETTPMSEPTVPLPDYKVRDPQGQVGTVTSVYTRDDALTVTVTYETEQFTGENFLDWLAADLIVVWPTDDQGRWVLAVRQELAERGLDPAEYEPYSADDYAAYGHLSAEAYVEGMLRS